MFASDSLWTRAQLIHIPEFRGTGLPHSIVSQGFIIISSHIYLFTPSSGVHSRNTNPGGPTGLFAKSSESRQALPIMAPPSYASLGLSALDEPLPDEIRDISSHLDSLSLDQMIFTNDALRLYRRSAVKDIPTGLCRLPRVISVKVTFCGVSTTYEVH